MVMAAISALFGLGPPLSSFLFSADVNIVWVMVKIDLNSIPKLVLQADSRFKFEPGSNRYLQPEP